MNCGAGEKSAATEIDAITGATISSKAVVKIMNETNKIWLSRLTKEAPAPLPDGGENPGAAKGAGE